MRFHLRAIVIAAAYLTNDAHALPRPATYSVVNVDGGQTQSAIPTTIIQTITESSDHETTISVTGTATVVSIPTTIVETTARATETALIPEVSRTPQQSEASAPQLSSVAAPAPTPPTIPEPETVTVVSMTTATPTTSYYDNGMWHTSYAIKPVATPSQDTPLVVGYVSRSTVGTGALSSGYAQATGSYSSGGWNSTIYR